MTMETRNPTYLLGQESDPDQTLDYSTTSWPFLYAAFRQWRSYLEQSLPNNLSGVLNSATNETVATIDTWARGLLSLGHDLFDEGQAGSHFPTSFESCRLPTTVEETQSAVGVWFTLLQRRTWEEIDSRFPRLAV